MAAVPVLCETLQRAAVVDESVLCVRMAREHSLGLAVNKRPTSSWFLLRCLMYLSLMDANYAKWIALGHPCLGQDASLSMFASCLHVD